MNVQQGCETFIVILGCSFSLCPFHSLPTCQAQSLFCSLLCHCQGELNRRQLLSSPHPWPLLQSLMA